MKKIENFIIKLNDEFHEVFIIRKKIKNTYIRIDESYKIKVTTNYISTLTQIKQLIIKNEDKIIKQIVKKKKRCLASNQIAYMGKIYYIDFEYNSQYRYEMNDDKIIFYLPDITKKEVALERFYQERANITLPKMFQECLKMFQERFDIKQVHCQYRKMKVRYGTCYYKKNKIILNTFLVKYDIKAIEYVIYHELCHFIHHDHSKRFYELLNSFVKDHRSIRQLLNKY